MNWKRVVGRTLSAILVLIAICFLLVGAVYTAGALDEDSRASDPFATTRLDVGLVLLGVGVFMAAVGFGVARKVWRRPKRPR